MPAASIQYHLLSGFNDPKLPPEAWNALQCKGSGNTVFMTWQWQKTWWEIFGRGKLLLLLAVKNDQPVTIAPLFADGGMLFFVGSGGSDYLDFIGDTSDPEIITGLLHLAIENTPGLLGFRFYHIPASSPTQQTLATVARKLIGIVLMKAAWPALYFLSKTFLKRQKPQLRKKACFATRDGLTGMVELKYNITGIAQIFCRTWILFSNSISQDGQPHLTQVYF